MKIEQENAKKMYLEIGKMQRELDVVKSELDLLCSRRSRLVNIAVERTARLHRRHVVLFAERKWANIEHLYARAYKNDEHIAKLNDRKYDLEAYVDKLVTDYQVITEN